MLKGESVNKKLLVRNSPRTEHRHSCEKPNRGHLGAAGAGPGSPTVWRTARPQESERSRRVAAGIFQLGWRDTETSARWGLSRVRLDKGLTRTARAELTPPHRQEGKSSPQGQQARHRPWWGQKMVRTESRCGGDLTVSCLARWLSRGMVQPRTVWEFASHLLALKKGSRDPYLREQRCEGRRAAWSRERPKVSAYLQVHKTPAAVPGNLFPLSVRSSGCFSMALKTAFTVIFTVCLLASWGLILAERLTPRLLSLSSWHRGSAGRLPHACHRRGDSRLIPGGLLSNLPKCPRSLSGRRVPARGRALCDRPTRPVSHGHPSPRAISTASWLEGNRIFLRSCGILAPGWSLYCVPLKCVFWTDAFLWQLYWYFKLNNHLCLSLWFFRGFAI